MKADPPFPERRAASRRAFKAPLGIGWQVTLKAALKNRRHITAELTRNLRGTDAELTPKLRKPLTALPDLMVTF